MTSFFFFSPEPGGLRRTELGDSICTWKRSNEPYQTVGGSLHFTSPCWHENMVFLDEQLSACNKFSTLATRRVQNVLYFVLLRRKRKREWGGYKYVGLFLLFIRLQSHEWAGSWQTGWRSAVYVCRVQSDLLSFMLFSHSIHVMEQFAFPAAWRHFAHERHKSVSRYM